MILFVLLINFFSIFHTPSCSPVVERDNIVIISDSHIGGPWFSPDAKTALPAFLRTLTLKNTSTHTLILNGDFLDVWLFNFTEPIPAVSQLLSMTNFRGINISEYVSIFKSIISNHVKIIYINGNHDDHLRPHDFAEVGLSQIEYYNNYYINKNMRIEHGHRYDIFNCVDPSGVRSVGYYMMRAATESGNTEIEEVSTLYEWMCNHVLCYAMKELRNATWFYERLMGGSLGERTWAEIANKMYREYENRDIEQGCFFYDGRKKSVIFRTAVRKFRTMVNRWLQLHDEKILVALVKGSCNDMDYFLQLEESQLFILGHTHHPLMRILKRVTYKGGNVVHVNTGSWTAGAEYFPFVKVVKKNNEDAKWVYLMKYDPQSGKEVMMNESPVPFPSDGDTSKFDKKIHMDYKCVLHEDDVNVKKENFEKIVKKKVPSEWICDTDFYDSNDGCDCECGAHDPDCDIEGNEECVYSCKVRSTSDIFEG